MAHVWTRRDEKWFAHLLEEPAYAIDDAGCKPLGTAPAEIPQRLIRYGSDEVRDGWAMVAAPDSGVRVNSEPLVLGLRVLRDRDEITVAESFGARIACRFYFSTEATPVVQTMPQAECSGVCPRCRGPIQPGSNVVRCPLCRVFHHQNDADGICWTYDAVCANCRRQPTSLDGQFQWTPELL